MSVSTGTPGAQGAGGDFPPVFYGTIRIIDRFSDLTGRLFALVQIFLVVTITYEVVVRYFMPLRSFRLLIGFLNQPRPCG